MKPSKNKVQTILQKLPSVSEVLEELNQVPGDKFSEKQVTDCIRKCIEKHRQLILKYPDKEKKLNFL